MDTLILAIFALLMQVVLGIPSLQPNQEYIQRQLTDVISNEGADVSDPILPVIKAASSESKLNVRDALNSSSNGILDFEISPLGSDRLPRASPTFFPVIQKSVNSAYTLLKRGQSAQIFSTNYGQANYRNGESLTWEFQGSQCTLSVYCPCADIAPSASCFQDYLRITDKSSFDQKFCGGNTPGLGSELVSSSDTIFIKFRTNSRINAKGFTCYVTCIGPGMGTPTFTTPATTVPMPMAQCPPVFT